ncbi:MAG: acetylglutamate kinase [Chloroflexi bacterium]|nr:acetylglutamate kinase [Chloroflexota bacterium]
MSNSPTPTEALALAPLRGVSGKTLVLKLGGSVGREDTLPEDVTRLQASGARVVVVHGGGPLITAWLDRTGKTTRFVNGLRYTDEETLDVVRMVLAGLVNGEVVNRIQAAGGRAVGLSGADDGMLRATVKDPELGLVGEISSVNRKPIDLLLDAGYVVVIAPVAVAASAQFLNINADTVAGEVARALGADQLIFLTDVPGISDGDRVLRELTPNQADALMTSGVVGGGMVPKVQACLRALAKGRMTQIVDGREAHAVLNAVQNEVSAGTRFVLA